MRFEMIIYVVHFLNSHRCIKWDSKGTSPFGRVWDSVPFQIIAKRYISMQHIRQVKQQFAALRIGKLVDMRF